MFVILKSFLIAAAAVAVAFVVGSVIVMLGIWWTSKPSKEVFLP